MGKPRLKINVALVYKVIWTLFQEQGHTKRGLRSLGQLLKINWATNFQIKYSYIANYSFSWKIPNGWPISVIYLSLYLCCRFCSSSRPSSCVFCCDAFCLWTQQCKRIQTVGRQQVSLWMRMCLCTNADERQPFPLASQSTSPGIRTIFSAAYPPSGIVFPSPEKGHKTFHSQEPGSNCHLKWVRLSVTNLKCSHRPCSLVPTPYSALHISWFASFAFVRVLSKYLKLVSKTRASDRGFSICLPQDKANWQPEWGQQQGDIDIPKLYYIWHP